MNSSPPIAKQINALTAVLDTEYREFKKGEKQFSFPGFSFPPSLFKKDRCFFAEHREPSKLTNYVKDQSISEAREESSNLVMGRRTRPGPGPNIMSTSQTNPNQITERHQKDNGIELVVVRNPNNSQLNNPARKEKAQQPEGKHPLPVLDTTGVFDSDLPHSDSKSDSESQQMSDSSDLFTVASHTVSKKKSMKDIKIVDYVFCGDINNLYCQLISILDFQFLYRKVNTIICVTIVCESPNKDIINSLLSQSIILYVFDQSPYYKHSYINPDSQHIHYYVSDKLLRHFEIDNEYLYNHIPNAIRLLKAERIVVSHYNSPDFLERIFSKDDVENTSISIIATTLLELFQDFEVELSGLFQGMKQIDYMSHILLLYPKTENEGSVYSPIASYVSENGLVEMNELSGISDALCTNVDLSTSSLFLPFTHLHPHLFDALTSIFLPKHYSYYPILPYNYPDIEALPYSEVFLRILMSYGIVVIGVISKSYELPISIAFPHPDFLISKGDTLLCLRANLRACSNGIFI